MPIIGFGKIGARSAKRFAAMETNVLVYDHACTPRRFAAWATAGAGPRHAVARGRFHHDPLPAAVDCMGVAAVENILNVLDGKPIHDNVVN